MGEADLLVRLTQSNGSVLWVSTGGNVSVVETLGWPNSDGTHDLGGGLFIERPSDPIAGTVNIGEAPRSMTFHLDG